MPVSFQFAPLVGDISGKAVLSQIEQAFNELGSDIDDGVELAQRAIDTANNAVAVANDSLNEAQNATTIAQQALSDAATAQITAEQALDDAATAQATAGQAMDDAATAQATARENVKDISFMVDAASASVIARIQRASGDAFDRDFPLASTPYFVANPNYRGAYDNDADINTIDEPQDGNFADNMSTSTEWLFNNGVWADTNNPVGTTSHGDETPGNDGMMPKESLRQIDVLTAAIENLTGIGRTYFVHLGANPVSDQVVLQKSYESVAMVEVGTIAPNGTTLVNLDEANGAGVDYTYFEAQAVWQRRGTASVNQAQTGVAGIVKGTPSEINDEGEEVNAGKIFVENDGTMRVLGFGKTQGAGKFVGEILLLPFRPEELSNAAPGCYFCNGDLYPLSSPVGKALNALPDSLKTDFGITVTDSGDINIPNMFYSDGRGFFLRAVDGVTRQVGSQNDDQMRPITGEARLSSTCAGVYTSGYANGAFYKGSSTSRTLSVQDGTSYNLTMNSSRLGANYAGSETQPLNIGMTPAIFLGV